MRRSLAVVPVALLLAGFAPSPCPELADPSAADLKKMQGTWDMVKATRNGKPIEKQVAGVTMVIEKDRMTIRDGKRDEAVTIKLDGKKNPRQIDIKPPKGERIVLGIYRLDRDELTICFSRSGGARPTKIDDTAGGLLVFRRKKK